MAKKKLEGERLSQFTELVMQGKTPEEIRDHFNIGISSVHNYKRKLREQGLDVPDVRGKRPSDLEPVGNIRPIFKVADEPTKKEDLTFIISGVEIKVTGKAKSVNVDGNTITIEV